MEIWASAAMIGDHVKTGEGEDGHSQAKWRPPKSSTLANTLIPDWEKKFLLVKPASVIVMSALATSAFVHPGFTAWNVSWEMKLWLKPSGPPEGCTLKPLFQHELPLGGGGAVRKCLSGDIRSPEDAPVEAIGILFSFSFLVSVGWLACTPHTPYCDVLPHGRPTAIWPYDCRRKTLWSRHTLPLVN